MSTPWPVGCGQAGSGCAQDLADAIFAGADSFNARCARRKANEILRDRRDEVIKLADRLFEHGQLDLDRN